MSGAYHIVIPARMAAQRLPGKPLLPVAGKPLIEHVWARAREASPRSVVIATDSTEILAAARGFGACRSMRRNARTRPLLAAT